MGRFEGVGLEGVNRKALTRRGNFDGVALWNRFERDTLKQRHDAQRDWDECADATNAKVLAPEPVDVVGRVDR